MVDRRSFLKGMGAALLVPAPKFWTPEERQLVLASDMPQQPVPTIPSPRPAAEGYLLGVFRMQRHYRHFTGDQPTGWVEEPTDRWHAFYVEPHSTVIGLDWDLPFTRMDHTYTGHRTPSTTRYTVEFDVYGEDGKNMCHATGPSPQQAARAAIEARSQL